MSLRTLENSFDNNHQKLGLALYAAMWLQFLTGVFKPSRYIHINVNIHLLPYTYRASIGCILQREQKKVEMVLITLDSWNNSVTSWHNKHIYWHKSLSKEDIIKQRLKSLDNLAHSSNILSWLLLSISRQMGTYSNKAKSCS